LKPQTAAGPSTTDSELDAEVCVAALKANIPTLLMVLYQLTGEDRWLEPPYAPTRPKGLDEHDAGGLPEDVQLEVREAAVDALRAYFAGASVAVPKPRGPQFLKMMSVCVGEDVPETYEPMMAAEMGFTEYESDPAQADAVQCPTDFQVAIIGAGIGGLLTAFQLRRQGIPCVVLERNADLGGTWFENRYPGAGVDVPSYLYCLSFFPWPWSRHFPGRDEVLAYLNAFADHFDLRRSISFETEVVSAVYDDARQRWVLNVSNPNGTTTLEANVVISATGLFSRPSIPDIPGRERFRGPTFHSARWPDSLSVDGKRVAIIGNGASAMQIVPAIVGMASEVVIFQRTPQWIAPAKQYFEAVPEEVHWLCEHAPFYLDWYRFRLAWMFNDKVHPTLFKDPDWPHPDRSLNAQNDRHRDVLTRYMESELKGRDDLLAKTLPDYPPYGKRMLLDNGWFKALRHPNVELVNEACVEITESTVQSDSVEREVDVVVFCTGFDTHRYLAPIDFVGRGGRHLRDDWDDDDARAYLGITVPGYPNMFMIYGPNTNGSGGSYFSFVELQVGYIGGLIERLCDGTVTSVDPRVDRFEDYNRRVDELHSAMVWTHPGMSTYFRNSRGRVVVNRPWSVVEYWQLVREPDLSDFELESWVAQGELRPACSSSFAAPAPSGRGRRA
jgi:4-hydroxyacetophenone monooxygenase